MTKEIFQQWGSEVEDLRGVADMHEITRNQSYLAYLSFAHVQVTGARLYTVLPDFDGIPDYPAIIAACLHEAYELGREGEDACDMSSLRFTET